MEARRTITKVIGFACCLAFLGAVSFHGVDGTQAAEEQRVQRADTLSAIDLSDLGEKGDSLTGTAPGYIHVPGLRQKADTKAPQPALGIKEQMLLDRAADKGNTLLDAVAGASGTRSAQGGGGCTIFNNKADFEAFNADEGKEFKGLEDFEETLDGTPITGFPDPLCGGIPNPPYDNGLDEDNLCVQANTLAGDADVPSPHGDNGLVFVPFGAGFGETSDILLANYFAESLDVMFGDPVPPDQQDNHTGVGFDVVAIFGGGNVDIEVYDKDNNLLTGAGSPADAAGSNFWGVWCPTTIGRINLFDTGGGAQGADNIQMWLEGEGGPACEKDIEITIPTCDEPAFKVLGDTTNESNDAACRDSNDLIITFDILEAGFYTFDLTVNVDPCMWDSYMYLVQGDACACDDVIAFNDDCPGIGCFGQSCIGPVTLEPGTYWIVVEGFSAADAGPVDLHVTSECPPPPGNCTIFDNKGEFEAFNADHGKILKGIEDFEETLDGTPITGFPDPLCGGIPNPPYDNGLDEDNLCVQANTLAGDADVPSPHGDNGLVFVPFGAGFGETSDILLANYFAESLDVMFGDPVPPDQQDNHTGVGFDVVAIFGGGTVGIRVFDKDNNEMASATSPSDAAGSNFWGIWCPDTIGRINVFDLGGGAQGADNIQMWLEDEGDCKDVEVVIGSCDEPAFKVLGDTTGAGNDAACRDSEDFIITFDIAQAGNYTFDLTVNVDPCMWDSYMYLVQGDACACDEVIAFNDDCPGIGCFGQSCIGPVTLEPGSYWIVVEGFSAADAGPVDLHVTSACVPDPAGNDNCEDREPIFDGDTPIDTTQATTDGLPTSGSGDCADFGDPQIHNDIWFNYDATCDGQLNVSTCDTVDYDSKIAIYEDCDIGLCPRGDDEIGCNDDGPNCGGFTTIATADVVAGNCYKIRIGGFSDGDRGTGTVNIECKADLCPNGVCDPGEDECNCPQDCPGDCECFLFDNKAEFEAFNSEEGKLLKGIEDFEEGTLPPNGVDGMDDPLCGGIPNAPDGFPYPEGLTELNLCVQSNILGGDATDPAPQGVGGLAAASEGFLGAVSDIVISNTFVNSLDIMFGDPVPPDQQDNHTGIGFDTLALLGGNSVDIQVYDKNNALLVATSSPADAAGSNFWGIWCSSTIGRINIFDPGTGAEGGDNIQMWLEDAGCQSDDECDDGNPCTNDVCDPDDPNADENGCVHTAVSCKNQGDECNDAECDPNGAGGNCDTPIPLPNGTSCGSGSSSKCDNPDSCQDGACQDNNAPDGTNCGDGGTECTNQDTCAGGSCQDNGFQGSGTPCGSNSGTECDNADTCDGAGGCQDNNEPDGTNCGDDGTECTNQDTCADGGCQDNGFQGSGTGCGSAEDTECDDPDTCDGAGGCQDNNASAGDPCGDQDVDCQVDDTCDGDGGCTDNGHQPDGTACTDDGENCTSDECVEGECTHPSIEQTLIIKQGASGQGPDCNAPVNANSNGVIPILLVGTGGFDVHDVDQGSLDLHVCGEGPSGVGPIAGHTKFKDLNHPTDLPVGCPGCQCNDDESSDGIDDLSMKFSTSDVMAILGDMPQGAWTLELTGTANGVPFCSRDCIIVVPPGSGLMNATMESNVQDTLLEVTPMDLNFDIDGFADFSRAYVEGTTITLTAPSASEGRRFLRWSINGEMQEFGIRTIDVTISKDTTLKAFYLRPGRVIPELPSEGSGDME